MTKAIKLMKWSGIGLFGLIVLAVSFYAYLVHSFDDRTLPENHGKVNTELFLGDGINQPLIVGFGGSEGGNAWASDFWKGQRDSFISQGYSFLAVAYFGEEGTPQNLDRIDLGGVHRAIREAAADPSVNGECVILIGGSKGAELALLLGSQYSDIDAVVGIVPGNAVFPALTIAMNTPSFTSNGENLPFVPVPWSATWPLIKGDLRAVWEEMLKNQSAVERASIEVEKINGPVLFLSATKDEFWPSTQMSAAMEQRLAENGFSYPAEHVAIEGGHAAPIDHFDEVERFLVTNVQQGNLAGCSEPS